MTLKLVAFVGLLLVAGPVGARGDSVRPHVVVILADDLGYGDPACYGGKIPTPNLDRLAREGMRFTDAHTPSAVCTPTRYGLLTGRYNWRTKLQRGVLGGLSPRLIEPGRVTIASFLHQQGYRTACVGKWHLGMDWVRKPGQKVTELNIEPREQVWNVDYNQPIANGPNSVGFDEYFGISASLDMVPYTFIRNDRVTADPTEDREFLMMEGRPNGGKTRKGPTAPGFDARDVLPAVVREARDFIARQTKGDSNGKPFFLYVPLPAPHTPILPTAEWQGKSGMHPYADFVMQTDAAVGSILAALEDNSVASKTLVIVTSDNGCSPQAKFEELEKHGHNPSGPLRGHKADLFEGGHRVPFLVRWPGRVEAGKESPKLVCLTDVLATIAEVIDKPLPETAGEDSFSFLSALKTGEVKPETESAKGRGSLVSHSINGSFAIRKGPWKLLICPDSGGWSPPRPDGKAAKGLPPLQLYHLADDLAESRNVAAEHPDLVEELKELIEGIVRRGRSTPGADQQNAVPVDLRFPKWP